MKTRKLDTQVLGVAKEELARIDLENCEIVRRQYLSHIKDNSLTIRPDGIQFNNSCLLRMPDTNYVYLIIDRRKKWFIILGCEEDDKDGQKWCNEKDGKRVSRKITGRLFSDRLYALMQWKKGFYYKVCGTPALRVDDEDQILLVFELEDYEEYPLTKKSRVNAGIDDQEIKEEDLAALEAFEKQKEAEKAAREEAKKAGKTPAKAKAKDRFPESWSKDEFGPLFSEHKGKVEMPRISKEELIDDLSLLAEQESSNKEN